MSEFKEYQKDVKVKRLETGGRCVLCSQVHKLTKERIRDYYKAMLDTTIEIPTIVAVLRKWEVSTSPTTISNHRTGKLGLGTHMEIIKKATK